MSPDHESSYYEIALTNRQVLTIFVVLLTCLVAAFLSGVWIGRRGEAQATLRVASSEPPPEESAAPMTELNFFSEAAPRDGRAEASAREPQRQPDSPAETPAASPAAESPASQPPPAGSPPAAKAPAGRAPAPAGAPSAATSSGRVIQVFSTLDAEQADRLVRRLDAGGYPAFLVEESLQGRITYRVRVGPYQQDDKAQKIAEQLRRDYRLETWITTQPG